MRWEREVNANSFGSFPLVSRPFSAVSSFADDVNRGVVEETGKGGWGDCTEGGKERWMAGKRNERPTGK